jgi:hypothetical protein
MFIKILSQFAVRLTIASFLTCLFFSLLQEVEISVRLYQQKLESLEISVEQEVMIQYWA